MCLFYLVLLMGGLVQMNPPAMGIGGTLLGLPLEAELSRQEACSPPKAGLRKPLPPGVVTSGPRRLPCPPRVCPPSLCCAHAGSQHAAAVSSCLLFIPSGRWSSPPSSHPASLAQASVLSPLEHFGFLCAPTLGSLLNLQKCVFLKSQICHCILLHA